MAYLAGLIDADGSVCLIRTTTKTGVCVAVHCYVATQDPELRSWLLQTFTGREHKMGRVHAWFPPSPSHLLLERVRPYMHTKGAQVDLVLEYKQADNKYDVEFWTNRSKELNGRLPKLYSTTQDVSKKAQARGGDLAGVLAVRDRAVEEGSRSDVQGVQEVDSVEGSDGELRDVGDDVS